jgi:shikimate dehydrogenase
VPESYAEVIGDPIGHSLSPAIHNFWLQRLGIEGSYRATRATSDDLAAYFEARRNDPAWRGCNVTAPVKAAVLPFLQIFDEAAQTIGAVNCVTNGPNGLAGINADVEGVAEALGDVDLAAGRVVIIGGGGAARAAAHYLQRRSAAEIVMLVRVPGRVALSDAAARYIARVAPLDAAPLEFDGAAAVINATPLGMAHAPPMPASILASLDRLQPSGVALDMVYEPRDTAFLAAARAAKLRTVDGLVMLVGQARPAFQLFFGAEPLRDADAELRCRLRAEPV